MPAGDGGRAMTDSHEEKALLGLCRAPSLMSATPSRVRSAPHARAAYGHVPYKVRRRSMQIYSPPGTARSFARRCACSELAGIRLLIRSRRHSLKYSLDPQTRAPTGCTNTRTPTECLACSNSPGLPFPHASWLPCLPLAARQPRVLFGPLLPCWHYSMRVRLHRPVYCVVDAGAHAEQTL